MSNTTHTVHKEILPNGLVVLTEPMEHVHSVSVGIWLRAGSRRERPKSTASRISSSTWCSRARSGAPPKTSRAKWTRVGGMLDAFTSKEMICFNTRVLDEHLPMPSTCLRTWCCEPKFAAEDIAREQSVVLEEIHMTQDNPEDLVHELFTQNFWRRIRSAGRSWARPKRFRQFTRDTLQGWFEQWYAPNHMVITAAGHLAHAQLVDLVSRVFRISPRVEDGFTDPKPVPSPHITLRTKSELEQVHICLGVPALPLTDRRRFAVSVLNNILGGGMSSRLFQNIRERQGLAYAIFSDLTPYRDVGRALGLCRHFARNRRQGCASPCSENSARCATSRLKRKNCAARRIISRARRSCRSKAAARA